MNKHLKEFFKRGLMFGGFGPVILGIVYLILEFSIKDFSLSGKEVFFGIISTYMIAFVHAGVSVINQIESLPVAKAMLLHIGSLYAVYTFAYFANSWIPFKWQVLLIYTAAFIITYIIIWLTVYFMTKAVGKRLSAKLVE